MLSEIGYARISFTKQQKQCGSEKNDGYLIYGDCCREKDIAT
ncbi:hypothetical protein [Sporomusa acidovorans]|uniref:Resolvase/invertase-type recombinase catalytic domain-containing protein n=1 Tax=Sporomusa acidovorans (strain ATCC 49682 / DSM 3132 / Mol) TaxID=1123286 RepID=A0ABZ3J6K2_SPOA4|nr:hypothetical protein [Sporomusa acidovorans]OZC18479.1 hypothetical protein SPACI_33450 [Sporomusa acidovorans DSM 3132]SDE36126.1 hypothetical protein SAMN04488499_101215 [Sporomusa acidovorans]